MTVLPLLPINPSTKRLHTHTFTQVGGMPLVSLEVEDVFWAVLEELNSEEASNAPPMGRPRSNSASLALAEHRAASRLGGPSPAPTFDTMGSGSGVVVLSSTKNEEVGRLDSVV